MYTSNPLLEAKMLPAVASRSPPLQCSTCKKTFGKKSSLVRHLKICQLSLTSGSRQKSCERCSATKSKCDQQWPSCGRCSLRKSTCNYKKLIQNGTQSSASSHIGSDTIEHVVPLVGSPRDSMSTDEFKSPHPGLRQSPSSEILNEQYNVESGTPPSLYSADTSKDWSFQSVMAHFGNFDDIGTSSVNKESPNVYPDAWLQRIVPLRKPISPLQKHSMEFSFRILRTWPHMMASRIQVPPIFHHTQLKNDGMEVPLAHCYTIAKMWHGQCQKSTALVHETTVREMTNLFQNYRKLDEGALLAALQSMTIYMIILLFPIKGQASVSVVDMAILANLQQLINYIGSLGLSIREEQAHVRPTWEAWINITSRRRAVLSLYMVHWSLSLYHGLPSFDCEELHYMLAPAPKYLWQAKDREEWELRYSHWLVDWEQQEYLHGEIGHIKPGVSLDSRSEKWLAETDELGIFLMSLVNATE